MDNQTYGAVIKTSLTERIVMTFFAFKNLSPSTDINITAQQIMSFVFAMQNHLFALSSISINFSFEFFSHKVTMTLELVLPCGPLFNNMEIDLKMML